MSTKTEGGTERIESHSTPDTVVSPEDVRKIDMAKDDLFIYIYHRRELYFQRWRKTTWLYFGAIKYGMDAQRMYWESQIEICICKFENRIRSRLTEFANQYHYELETDGLPFLDGIDMLMKPVDKDERRELIQKEREYDEKYERINPSTAPRTPGEEDMVDEKSTTESGMEIIWEEEGSEDVASSWADGVDDI